MEAIRIVWGVGHGPTSIAAYDAALAAANIHNHNLVGVSSVVPSGARIDIVGNAPDLGPPGTKLTVVEAKSTVPPGDDARVAAGLGWARETDGPGIFYEAGGTDAETVRTQISEGLESGKNLREWAFDTQSDHVEEAPSATDAFTTVVVLAVYGRGVDLL